MRSPGIRAACGVGLLAVLIGSYLQDPQSIRAGQIVFVPASGVVEEGNLGLSGAVSIQNCTTTADGLLVTGIVATDDELATVLVWPVRGETAGVAVGNGAPMGSTQGDGGSGRFEIALPWASTSSRFALVDADSLGEPGEPVTGAGSTCPDSEQGG